MDEERIPVICGSCNVFVDLHLPDAEALLLKADQAFALRNHLDRHRLSMTECMQLLGATADEVGALRRGRVGEISSERMAEFFGNLPKADQADGDALERPVVVSTGDALCANQG